MIIAFSRACATLVGTGRVSTYEHSALVLGRNAKAAPLKIPSLERAAPRGLRSREMAAADPPPRRLLAIGG